MKLVSGEGKSCLIEGTACLWISNTSILQVISISCARSQKRAALDLHSHVSPIFRRRSAHTLVRMELMLRDSWAIGYLNMPKWFASCLSNVMLWLDVGAKKGSDPSLGQSVGYRS